MIQILSQHFSAEMLHTDSDTLTEYGRDWTRYHEPNASVIFFPKTIEDIQKIVLLANEHDFVLVPSGGRTGLSAGAVATQGEVVVSMDKMNQILDYNELNQTLTVQTGIITQVVQEFAEEKGLIFPINFAAEGSSQIGGNIATNAGGIKVVKYGMFRDWVLGLKVVTGTGDILELNKGLVKNATGYALHQLFIGSEGTLGFVVEATLKLTRPPQEREVVMFAMPDMDSVVQVMNTVRKKIDLLAFEFLSDNAIDYVMEHTNVAPPMSIRHPFYTVMEFEGNGGKNMEIIFDLYEKLAEKGIILEDVFAQDDLTRTRIWGYREHISSSISSFIPYKNDISVTISNVAPFLNEINQVVKEKYPDFTVLWFGHIADGNLHLNIIKPNEMSIPDFEEKCKSVNGLVFDIVQKYEGSISAEHGVGLLKKPYLDYTRSKTEIEYLRKIKQVFDPKEIMNRGKLI